MKTVTDEAFQWLEGDSVRAGRRQQGFSVTELLDLSESARELLIEITRREPVTLVTLATATKRNLIDVETQLSQLVTQGWVDTFEDESGEWVYRARLARDRKRLLPPGIWQVLDEHWTVPILRLFPDAMREEFSRHFQLRSYEPGAILFRSGTWGERMYVVEAGKIQLLVQNQAGEPFVIQEIGTGGMLGEIAVLLGEQCPYTAKATEQAQVWTLDKSELDRFLREYPSVGLAVRHELSRHLRSLSSAAEPRQANNPVVVVGKGGGDLARHLAAQTTRSVMLVDLAGDQPESMANLAYLDGRSMHSRNIAATVREQVEGGVWVLIASSHQMTDQLMRLIGLAPVIIDLTHDSAPWLRAVATERWSAPSTTPLHLARLARKLRQRTVGLVLSGGYARAMAHLGVLDVLHRSQIPIDALASCGYGAVWAGLCAAGRSPEEMISAAVQQAHNLRPFGGRLRLKAASRPGLYDARPARSWIQSMVGELGFSDLQTPLYLAVADLLGGDTVCLTQGPLFSALSACVAAPGLVTPVRYEDRWFVDSLLSDPLPVDILLEHRTDVLIASSAIPAPGTRPQPAQDGAQPPDLVTGWLGACDATIHERSLRLLSHLDLVITPDVAEFSDAAFERTQELVERGRQAAEAALPRIQSLLQREESTG
jgi:NTE family protein